MRSVWVKLFSDALADLAAAAEQVAMKAQVGPIITPRFRLYGAMVWPFTFDGRTYWLDVGVDDATWRPERRWPPAVVWWRLDREGKDVSHPTAKAGGLW